MSWLIIVDQNRDFANADTPHKVMTSRDYLSRPQLFGEMKPKIINLSRNYSYQASGYYCSLLAEARGHRIIPAVETMVELSKKTLYKHALPELEDVLNRCLEKSNGNGCNGRHEAKNGEADLLACFGMAVDPVLSPFSRLLFDWFRAPILRVQYEGGEKKQIKKIALEPLNALKGGEMDFLRTALDAYTRRAWRAARTRVPAKYTLAVLYDPQEELAPSKEHSLKHFAKVAEKHSLEVAPITKGDLDRLAEFDALFIRETTSIDNHTYRFARRAQQEGMPVIDDPQSMIRCTNKVYLAELLTANRLPTPKTVIVQSIRQAEELPGKLGWPVVLKIPDGSFSRGVFKTETPEALKTKLKALLEESDLVIAQEYIPTAFDWRIGVLDGEPLYACQYMMAHRHWQIVKHEPGKAPDEGRFKTLPLGEVPKDVMKAAVEAARLIGDGLYGVDLKQTDKGLYIIEVNDNPDLNHGIEDLNEKDVLWEKLINWYLKRLEA
ncbi:glutathione synthase/RimK-type ligase-like ATP-grasp enzyme [Rhodoligotrophos appendicifer]|uniref:RimK family protein n=1 Tax=Rhodoligotrophos appendicifer TaxID=987056 RepID=UPI00118571BA|nr:RimK family protein [Rhodoligotrophos appendicifer]